MRLDSLMQDASITDVASLGVDMIEQARAGHLSARPLAAEERLLFGRLIDQLKKHGIALLESDAAQGLSHVNDLAAAIAAGTAPNEMAGKRLILAPVDVPVLSKFARTSDILSQSEAVVVLDLDSLFAPPLAEPHDDKSVIDAVLDLFFETELWIIAVGTNNALTKLLARDQVMQSRLDARAGRIHFCVRLRDQTNLQQQIVFSSRLDLFEEGVSSLRSTVGKSGSTIEILFSAVVQSLQSGRVDDDSKNTIALVATWVFDLAMPLRVGKYHMLTIDITGSRYRLKREYFNDNSAFEVRASIP
jgi:hypothetical protein